jgi:hypothetical protein
MGLNIKKYSYGYSMLQRLREGALQVEKNLGTLKQVYKDDNFNTKFTAFIEHNDCEGGYLSKTSKKFKEIEKYSNDWYDWGHSLEDLKKECDILNQEIYKYLSGVEFKAWQDFYSDVKSAKKILKFH